MDRDAEGIEFAINVPTSWTRSFLLLRTRFARSGEFAIVVPATQKPFERVLVATFMLRIFSFSAFTTFMAENSPLLKIANDANQQRLSPR